MKIHETFKNTLYFKDGHTEEILNYKINHLSYVIFETAENSYLFKNRTFIEIKEKIFGEGLFIKYVPKVGIEDAEIDCVVLVNDTWKFKHAAGKFGIGFIKENKDEQAN